jgi:chemotaxis protein CheC
VRKVSEENLESKFVKLTPEQLDILKELGNIGSGHAITALSELINEKVDVSLTAVNLIPFWKIPELFELPNSEVFGIYSEILGKTDISIIQIFTKESVINLINILNENAEISLKDINVIEDLDDFSYSIISEIGNILSGNYASALANLLSIAIVPGVPKLALDRLSAMLDSLIAKYSQFSNYSIVVKTKIWVKEIKLDGTICLVPSIEILNDLFKILKIKYNADV